MCNRVASIAGIATALIPGTTMIYVTGKQSLTLAKPRWAFRDLVTVP